MHTQYAYEWSSPEILGTVFEIDECNKCQNFDFYQLTQKGRDVVQACNRSNKNLSGHQHPSCHSREFYQSLMKEVSIPTAIPVERHIFAYILPIDEENNSAEVTRCAHCLKVIYNTSLLKHVAHNSKCKKVYGDKYEDIRTYNRRATSNEYKRNNISEILFLSKG